MIDDPEFWARLAAHREYTELTQDAWRALAAVLGNPLLGDYEPQTGALRAALGWLQADTTCGDCVEGRCHWGGAGPDPGEECGCDRHEFSAEVAAYQSAKEN